MAPKKKAAKKKGTSTLSRGRTAKPPKDDDAVTTTATSDTDDTASEHQRSPVRSKQGDDASSNVSPTSTTASTKIPSDGDDDDAGGAPKENYLSWKDIPDLTEGLRGGDGTITYVTKTREHREFELEARRELAQQYLELETLKSSMDASIKAMRSLCPDVKNGKISDAIRTLGCPTTFKEFFVKLTIASSQGPQININEPVFEESEAEDVLGVPFTGSNLQSKRFPSPAKMAKYTTPKNQGSNSNRVFQFGGSHSKDLSTNSKAARLAKPGEVVYSQGGSPILLRRIPENKAQIVERVEIVEPDGSKYDVELVYRGGKDASKVAGFKEIAKDVRGIAASRATSVRQNRIQPPKIIKANNNAPAAAAPQSASKGKNKPEWR